MITYQRITKSSGLQYKVRLDKKLVGGIYKNSEGKFYYRPTSHTGGDLFNTLEGVKQSLEEEQHDAASNTVESN